MLVEGEIEGEVRVDATVTVGAEGVVTGPVAAPVVRIGGRVIGDVMASDRVEVSPSGSLEGNISAPRIIIAEGAFFKGIVDMRKDKAAAAARRYFMEHSPYVYEVVNVPPAGRPAAPSVG